MSSTFLRGLALLEIVGVDGPIGVSDLARRLGADKASVSRMVTVAARDGWLRRIDAGVVLGPRLPVLAHHSDLAAVLRDRQPIVDAVAGVTGLFTHAYLAVGTGTMPVLAAGRPPISLPRPPGLEMPLWSIAAGRALATLIPSSRLLELVPDDAFTPTSTMGAVRDELGVADAERNTAPDDPVSAAPATQEQFLSAVHEIRAAGVAYDRGDVHPMVHCIAVPWPGLPEPAALSVIGTPDDLATGAGLAEAVLRAAVLPTATRERVVERAARHQQGGGTR